MQLWCDYLLVNRQPRLATEGKNAMADISSQIGIREQVNSVGVKGYTRISLIPSFDCVITAYKPCPKCALKIARLQYCWLLSGSVCSNPYILGIKLGATS